MIIPANPIDQQPLYSVERQNVAGGSELITIFQDLPDKDHTRVPLLSVLRDTLGDSDRENDRLRYVWLLSSVRPGWWQRMAAAIPFFYVRAGSRTQDGAVPAPIIDLSQNYPRVLRDVSQISLQLSTLDPAGFVIRAPARAYFGNTQREQMAALEQALAVITALEDQPGSGEVFSSAEVDALRARLYFGQTQFGGIVPENRFARLSANELRETEEARSHNWELIRQDAESSGLWFDPLSLGRKEPNYALVWIRRRDLMNPGKHRFEGQFLKIRDPWTDPRLQAWNGYSAWWAFDGDQRRTGQNTEGASIEEMIPLSLYDLEHPRTPLLLVDFRDTLKPKRHEIFERGVTDIMKSTFSLSYLRDWYYFMSRNVRNSVSGKHGVALDPAARTRAYSKLKFELGLDRSLDPPLQSLLQEQLAHLAMNPLESNAVDEQRAAEEHYRLLTRAAQDPEGLPAMVDRARSAEVEAALHSGGTRFLYRAGAVASFGQYHHRETMDTQSLAVIDMRRRMAYHERFVRQVAASPRPEVEFNVEQVRQSLEFLAKTGSHASAAVAQLFSRTQDESLRLACLDMLRGDSSPKARRELVELARRNQLDDKWRQLCLLYAQEKRTVVNGPASWNAVTGSGFSLAPHKQEP